MGLTRGANRAHFARAVLESITYQVTDLIEAMSKDSGIVMNELRVDGGASVSNIMLQIQANLASSKVNRPKLVETTALGAAYMAGLAVGFWKDFDEIERVREVDRIFVPAIDNITREEMLKGWHKAVDRSRDWEEK
jgi:glycerol kinase